MLPLLFFVAGLITTGGVAPAQSPALERVALLTAGRPAARRVASRPDLAKAVQSTASVGRRLSSRVVVTVPADDALLKVNDAEIPGAGASREFATGPLDAGTHQYTFAVTWEPNTYTTITRSKTVAFRAGDPVRVDLSVEDPADRVRVIYVPTPVDVAAAMVDLAAVGGDDVVYEPGCGDARITVAAIRAGARRG